MSRAAFAFIKNKHIDKNCMLFIIDLIRSVWYKKIGGCKSLVSLEVSPENGSNNYGLCGN